MKQLHLKSNHNLLDGQLVYYSSNNNQPIGIGTAFDVENKITGTLSDGAPYFVRSLLIHLLLEYLTHKG